MALRKAKHLDYNDCQYYHYCEVKGDPTFNNNYLCLFVCHAITLACCTQSIAEFQGMLLALVNGVMLILVIFF